MPLVAILATLLGEVEGHAIFMDWCRSTPWSGVKGHFDWWRRPCQLMFSRFSSIFFLVAAGGVVCQVFVSRLLLSREPCERRLLVESVVFPTDPPPLGVQGGAAISVTGCFYMQNR